MLDLGVEPLQAEDLVYVQEEPALEIALPQVFDQPELTVLQRGKLPHAEALAAQIAQRHRDNPEAPLGADYQELVTEFQPLFAWAIACWDYLLSTEGCRFLPRHSRQKFGVRGDYSAMTDKDYSRMVHGLFRACVLDFAQHARHSVLAGVRRSGVEDAVSGIPQSNGGPSPTGSLSHWLRERLWPRILEAYQRLENPPDPRQRTLTPYSYLRCVPYEFLNEFHHDLVYATVQRLPLREWQALDAYFLRFFTDAASAESLGTSVEEWGLALRHGLTTLLIHERLVYCLLRQIERY